MSVLVDIAYNSWRIGRDKLTDVDNNSLRIVNTSNYKMVVITIPKES